MLRIVGGAILAIFVLYTTPALAHFGIIIPSQSTVIDKKDANIKFDLAFSHPFEGHGMSMDRPEHFFAVCDGKTTDLLQTLKPVKYMDHEAWRGEFAVAKPGVCQFAVVPKPYFEPAENSFIIHYTKTVIGAYGEEEGWDEPLGLPVEIIPLTRPFANYAGNVFQGKVLRDGKPVKNCIVEIENLNIGGRHVAPNDYFVTQTVRTDANGVFSYGIPWAGWWGFAALVDGKDKIARNGKQHDVELGGVIWLQFAEPQTAAKGR